MLQPFANIAPGSIVLLTFAGSTQALAMRARYLGTTNGVHSLSGVGMLAEARFTATDTALSNGRTLAKVETLSGMHDSTTTTTKD